jgi:hypothetical protein
VSFEAQFIFDALRKMFESINDGDSSSPPLNDHRYNTRWDKQGIVIDERVRIDPPYTDDFFFALRKDVMAPEMDRYKMLVGVRCAWCDGADVLLGHQCPHQDEGKRVALLCDCLVVMNVTSLFTNTIVAHVCCPRDHRLRVGRGLPHRPGMATTTAGHLLLAHSAAFCE